MRIAVFSDVHGNIYALEKILKSMRKNHVDIFIFCGDICGYYYHQNEIIDIFRKMDNLYCVLGNHDKIFLDILSKEYSQESYTRTYGKSAEVLKNNISGDNLKFLKSLSHKKDLSIYGYNIGVFHGSPLDHLEGYVYPDTPIDIYESLPYQYIFLGHTHYQMNRQINDVTIVNPGSCGQPRDGNLPSYVLLDLEKKTLEFISIEYDPTLLIRDIRNHGETNEYLKNILYRGRK